MPCLSFGTVWPPADRSLSFTHATQRGELIPASSDIPVAHLVTSREVKLGCLKGMPRAKVSKPFAWVWDLMHHDWRVSGWCLNCHNITGSQNFRLWEWDGDKTQRWSRRPGSPDCWNKERTLFGNTGFLDTSLPKPLSSPRALGHSFCPGHLHLSYLQTPGSSTGKKFLTQMVFFPLANLTFLQSSPAQSSGGFQTVLLLLNGEVLTAQCRNFFKK